MVRLGVFGGSFDPVHRGHLHVALLAREAAGLDRVIFVPAARPPHKEDAPPSPAAHRVAMLEAALAGEPGTDWSRVELDPPAPRYTADTLDRLQELHPESRLHFILGLDSLIDLPGWREPERILRGHRVIAVDRPGFALDRVAATLRERCLVVEGNPFAISSTLIRDRVAAGLSIRHLVPAPVEAYIQEHGLYRPDAGSAS